MPDTAASVYQELIEAIIRKQASVLGMGVAVRRAKNVQGIEVNDQGEVTKITGGELKILSDLAEQFKALSGAIGLGFCREAAAGFALTHPGIKLPPIFL